MSFLKEVLSTAEETDIDMGKKNLPIISEKIVTCKMEINQYIDNVYHKFCEWPKKNQKLLDTTEELLEDIRDLQERIEQIVMKDVATKVNEVDNLSTELKRSSIALGIVIRLCQINELLLNVKELQKKKLYIKASHELMKAEESVNNIPDDEITEAITTLMLNILTEKGVLGKKLTELFEEDVKMTQTKSGVVQTNTIKIKKKCKEVEDVFSILVAFNKVAESLNKFSDFLCSYICKPIINSITTVKVEDEGGYYILTVAIKKATTQIPYKDVFNKLIEVFTFLNTHFKYEVGELNTVAYIGNKIKFDMSETILKDCLSETLPPTDEECNIYKNVIEDTKVFQSKLVELEIFDKDANPILDYANNMDIIFINKKCHEYLSTSIFFMKKDLHDSVYVGVPQDAGNPLTGYQFPESSVSRSTIEILELAQKILQQALVESDLSASRMICTVQSIFYQYGNIVYGHHEKLLQTIPQQVALFRNNCMYIAHQLAQLNDVYSRNFSRSVLPSPPLFTDQAHQLRTIGGEIFLAYVEEQIQIMEMTLQEYQFNSLQVAEELNPDTDKCLRQCVRQHELLKTVWLKVLPHSVYNKTLGYLLNAFCKKLVEVVIAAEDIPSKNAEQLVELYKVVLTRGPKLFIDPQEICLYVEMWQKLNDLVFILGASLVDIDDRWADGKGPLTLHFIAEEVRNLIKALFQNTDRRAAVLNKIHN